MSQSEVIIVGAGLAGLCCSLELVQNGIDILILEASDNVGGRVRTNSVNGFLLDRGFQVFLKAYPEARSILDYDALRLQSFYPGAWVYANGESHTTVDLWRKPSHFMKALFSSIGSITDKMRVAGLRNRLSRKSIQTILQDDQITTEEYLRNLHFSPHMIDHFFRPFFGGVFLEKELNTSSRIFEFTFKMFSSGDATLPERGMGQIPKQIASRLPDGAIRLNAQVASIENQKISLTTGEILEATNIVIATDKLQAVQFVEFPSANNFNGTTCLYFCAEKPPFTEPVILRQ